MICRTDRIVEIAGLSQTQRAQTDRLVLQILNLHQMLRGL